VFAATEAPVAQLIALQFDAVTLTVMLAVLGRNAVLHPLLPSAVYLLLLISTQYTTCATVQLTRSLSYTGSIASYNHQLPTATGLGSAAAVSAHDRLRSSSLAVHLHQESALGNTLQSAFILCHVLSWLCRTQRCGCYELRRLYCSAVPC
jgi:hypothetical protein